jgi:hypothetical protein
VAALVVVVESEHRGDGLHHAGRGTGRLTALEADAVLRTHAGEQRDLFPAEAFHAPTRPADGEAGVGGGDPIATRGDGGDPARLARALIRLATSEQPPVRWVAGADAVADVEQNAENPLTQVDAHRDLSSSLAHHDAWDHPGRLGTPGDRLVRTGSGRQTPARIGSDHGQGSMRSSHPARSRRPSCDPAASTVTIGSSAASSGRRG